VARARVPLDRTSYGYDLPAADNRSPSPLSAESTHKGFGHREETCADSDGMDDQQRVDSGSQTSCHRLLI